MTLKHGVAADDVPRMREMLTAQFVPAMEASSDTTIQILAALVSVAEGSAERPALDLEVALAMARRWRDSR